jgi:hypothetical protein
MGSTKQLAVTALAEVYWCCTLFHSQTGVAMPGWEDSMPATRAAKKSGHGDKAKFSWRLGPHYIGKGTASPRCLWTCSTRSYFPNKQFPNCTHRYKGLRNVKTTVVSLNFAGLDTRGGDGAGTNPTTQQSLPPWLLGKMCPAAAAVTHIGFWELPILIKNSIVWKTQAHSNLRFLKSWVCQLLDYV